MESSTTSFFWGAGLTIIGFLISHFYHNFDKKKGKHEKAIEIAKEFETILSSGDFRVEMIYSKVLEQLSILEKLSYLDTEYNDLSFDTKEINERIGEKKITMYKNYFEPTNTRLIKILAMYSQTTSRNEKTLNSIIQSFNINKNVKLNIETFISDIESKGDNDEEFNFKFQRDLEAYCEDIFFEFLEQRNNLMNRLEWMSMYFVTGLAKSEQVYQSLHQSYFALIKSIYLEIATVNDSEMYDRYYANMVEMFKKWKNIYAKKKLKTDKSRKKHVRKYSKFRGNV